MPQGAGWVEEERSDEVLLALRRIADKSHPHSPYFDNLHEYQRRAETAIVQDWAEEMSRLGHSVCKIKSNEDDPPDVLAVMDRNLIGIEVTMLVEYVPEPQGGVRGFRRDSPSDEGGSRIAVQSGSQSIPKYMPVVCDWTLEHFQIRLGRDCTEQGQAGPLQEGQA